MVKNPISYAFFRETPNIIATVRISNEVLVILNAKQ